ncbi:MAG: RNA methyltransferase [Lachnospiraceae bacterium]|nr:RNA methyltransferase [Lachnospiraceae bacterium]
MITALSNPKVKDVAALQKKAALRKEKGLFAAEGRRFVAEIPPERVVQAYATPDFAESPEGRALCERLHPETVSPEVMEKMSDTRSPQGILALVRMSDQKLCDLDPARGPLLILENVQDPGNIGTLFRTAEAAGSGGIVLSGDSADPYSPKVLRATMGAVFRLPFVIADDLPGTVRSLKEQGVKIFAAHLKGENLYTEAAFPEKTAFLLGNEGNGLSEEISALADRLIRIPMEGKTESLNVAVAGALLLYEAMRRRICPPASS